MSIRICSYTDSLIPSVREFNGRLRQGGQKSQFYETCAPHGLPKLAGRQIFEDYYLAVDEQGEVRGAYGLKHQDFWIGERIVSIADFWLPISEGTINKAYAPVAVALLLDALKKQPLLYGLGMGGYNEPLARLFMASGWKMSAVPFYFRVIHPRAFLCNIVWLRRNRARALALDLLANSGLGWLGIKALQKIKQPALARDPSLQVEEVAEFSDWSDKLWREGKDEYGLSAVRDSATLNLLYPKEKNRFIRLRVLQRNEPIGWAVLLDTQFSDHKQFGAMRLGSIVDCFARPGNAQSVILAARDVLEQRGVDLMVSNQSHAAWGAALKIAGFLQGPSNYLFATSPRLTEQLEVSGVQEADRHLNRGDGDGPNNL